MVETATLILTPWSAEALSTWDRRELGHRAVLLHCRVKVGRSRLGWTVRVASWAQDASSNPVHRIDRHHLRGNLAQHVHAILDAYERLYVYSPDELVAIQRQSVGAA